MEEFGYYKVIIETPQRDDSGKIVKNKKGQPVADTGKRDTENISMTEDIDAYVEREVLPFNEGAWYEQNKTKIGY